MMKKKRVDQEMPIGKLTRISDFLPPPDQLIVRDGTVKVTIGLKKSSVDFFKREAGKCHTKYQKMIREVLDKYASRYRAA